LRRLIEKVQGVRRSVGEEDRFVKAVKRAVNLLGYGASKDDAMQKLVDDGIRTDIAYFAVIAANMDLRKAGLK